MNKTWSFIDIITGEDTGRRFSGPEHALEMLELNTPEGCRAVEGDLKLERRDDPELQRARTIERIENLERKQHRRVRELLEASDPKLQEITREIESLRGEL